MGFSETFPFSKKITFWKKKTLTSLVNYSTLLFLTGITFHNKEKYSTQYNYSIFQLEYFFLPKFTKQLGSACTLLGFLRSMLLLDWPEAVTKYIQTYYSHFGNNDICIQGDKLQEYGGRLQ